MPQGIMAADFSGCTDTFLLGPVPSGARSTQSLAGSFPPFPPFPSHFLSLVPMGQHGADQAHNCRGTREVCGSLNSQAGPQLLPVVKAFLPLKGHCALGLNISSLSVMAVLGKQFHASTLPKLVI